MVFFDKMLSWREGLLLVVTYAILPKEWDGKEYWVLITEETNHACLSLSLASGFE